MRFNLEKFSKLYLDEIEGENATYTEGVQAGITLMLESLVTEHSYEAGVKLDVKACLRNT